MWVAALVCVAAIGGWYVGHAKATDVASTRPLALLSIETLVGGAALPPSHDAKPRLSGYLVVADLAPGQVVESVSWGDTQQRVPPADSPIEVKLETTVDCIDVGTNPATFPPIVVTLRNTDGSTSSLPVTPLSVARWGNVFTSCADPRHTVPSNPL